jgi:hypothetical protein
MTQNEKQSKIFSDELLLKLFNTRARILEESRFLNWLRTHGNKQPNMARLLAGDWLAFEGLHREDLDSFFLHLRTLIQNRDGYSICCLSKIYDQFPEDYEAARKEFHHVRNELKEYLDRKSLVQAKIHGSLSNRSLLNIILYGGFAHNDPKYFDNFVRMTQSGFFSFFTFTTLWNIVMVLHANIQKIALINNEVISWKEDDRTSGSSWTAPTL